MQLDEHVVLKSADLAEGQMRQVEVGELKVLLARVNGVAHAVAGTCPHYGAPLVEGVLCGSRVRCPWHQGCFDVTNGDLLEPPPLVSLRRYEAREEAGDIIVSVPAGGGPFRDPARATTAVTDTRRLVILGGGAAGECAAQTLREAGFGGRVLLVSPEPHGPYDRPSLSKNYLGGVPLDHPMPLQPPEFYEKHRIERVTRRAAGVEPDRRVVRFEGGGDGEPFDALLLAPGATPRRLGVTGENLPGVFMLRTLDDADAILAAVTSADRAVLVGSGFIGMEAAASLRHRGLEVIVVTPERVPMASKLGEPIGRMFQQVHTARGVKFQLGRKVTAFEGEGKLATVMLDDGTRIETPLAIVAVGVRPATGFLRGSFPLNDDGSLTVDRTMQVVNHPGVYAAGDVVRFPSPQTGEPIRVEHWRVAEQLGRVAAFNMAGVARVYDDVPYFWTFQYDVGLDYLGHAERWDAIHLDGDVGRREFLAYYLRGDKILAVSGCNRSDQVLAIAELMRAGRMPGAEVLRGGAVDWKGKL